VYDSKHRCMRKTGIIVVPVALPDQPTQPLWLVVARPGQGRTPWYLLTSDPIRSNDCCPCLRLLALPASARP
jgi:hypothetical protein